MGAIEGAVGDLEAAVQDGLLDAAQGEQLMEDLAAAARKLAANALDEAVAQGGDPAKIIEAQQAFVQGDGLRASGAFKDAVNKYKDALAKAEGALSKRRTEPENEDSGPELPKSFGLHQNYPNPFNPETVIQFDIPTKAGSGVEVELKIYNILGKLVYTLVDDSKRPGRYTVIWNGRYENGLRAASGVYLFQLKAGDFVKVRKMLLLK